MTEYSQGGSLLLRGRVLTMEARPEAEAVLIEGEKIAGVGGYEELRKKAREGTKTWDLRGRAILPGFIDSHTHLVGMGLEEMRPDLSGTNSLAEALEIARERVKASPPGEVILSLIHI